MNDLRTEPLTGIQPVLLRDFCDRITDLIVPEGLAVAMWRLPQSDEMHFILSSKSIPYSITGDEVEALPAGFVFAPYDKRKPGHFIPAEFMFRFTAGILKDPQSPAETRGYDWFHQVRPVATTRKIRGADRVSLGCADKDRFVSNVERCLKEIEAGHVEKIVPSRMRALPIDESFDPLLAFQRLKDSFPNAMVSLVYLPSVGCWIGASPELLVSVDAENVFHTVALAGTQPYREGMNLKTVAWTQKEIEEQALVERYIISCFKKIRLREYDEHGPKTVVAGSLLHLRSDFSVNLKDTHFPQLATTMLRLLHPTSAVCGMPHEAARELLEGIEGYDRSFYSGFLGPVNVDNATSLYVNLRCMEITRENILLYAGAGVTSDSDPQLEWEETEVKLDSLTKILE
jgi:isochorismate synthase